MSPPPVLQNTLAANYPQTNITAIRNLVRNAFTAQTLRRFCQDHALFRSLLAHFGPNYSLEDMTDVLIEYCEKKDLFYELLLGIQRSNPRQYERYKIHISENLAPSGELAEDRIREKLTRLELALEAEHKREIRTAETRRATMRRHVVNVSPLDIPSHFCDRTNEITSLMQYLADPTIRLIVIVGRGGMGKTALACKVLNDLEKEHLLTIENRSRVDGLIYLSTRTTGISLDRIFHDVGKMLGDPMRSELQRLWQDPDRLLLDRVQMLYSYLQDGSYIILLDSFEDQLNPGTGQIVDLDLRQFIEMGLELCSGTHVVVTSREWLRVPPSALRAVRHIALDDGLPIDEAVSLLRSLDPTGMYGLQEADEILLRRAAQLSNGIPRALELIAAILADPGEPLDLPALLEERSLFKEHVAHNLASEAYRRLDDPARHTMEALSAFGVPVSSTAIEYVLAPWLPDLDAQAALRMLVLHHHVTLNKSTGYYELHPIDRDSAYRLLPQGHSNPPRYDRQNLEQRVASYYAKMRLPKDQWLSIEDLASQLAEFDHLVKAQDYLAAAMLINELDEEYLSRWGYARRVLSMRQKLLGKIDDQRLHGLNLGYLGKKYHAISEYEKAIARFQQAISIMHRIGDRYHEAMWLSGLGGVYRETGQYKKSAECLKQALTVTRQIGDQRNECIHLRQLGNVYDSLILYDEAMNYFQQALILAREVQDKQQEITILGSLGRSYRNIGKHQKAKEYTEQALLGIHKTKDRRGKGVWLGNLGLVNLEMGLYEQALRDYKEAASIARDVGSRRDEVYALGGLGGVYLAMEKYDLAIEALSSAVEIAASIKIAGEQWARTKLARAYLHVKRLPDAVENIAVAQQLNVHWYNGHTAALHGLILAQLRNDGAAHIAFCDAQEHAEKLLASSSCHYNARYVRGLAIAGLTLLAHKDEQETLLIQAQDTYDSALKNCDARGLVKEALDLLNELSLVDTDRVLSSLQGVLVEHIEMT